MHESIAAHRARERQHSGSSPVDRRCSSPLVKSGAKSTRHQDHSVRTAQQPARGAWQPARGARPAASVRGDAHACSSAAAGPRKRRVFGGGGSSEAGLAAPGDGLGLAPRRRALEGEALAVIRPRGRIGRQNRYGVQICHKGARKPLTWPTEPRNHAVSRRPPVPNRGLCDRFGQSPPNHRLHDEARLDGTQLVARVQALPTPIGSRNHRRLLFANLRQFSPTRRAQPRRRPRYHAPAHRIPRQSDGSPH